MRCGKKRDDMPADRLQFLSVSYPEYRVGVPKAGKYKEIFNSDAKEIRRRRYGESAWESIKACGCDERADSVKIKAAPLSVAVFEYRKG